MPRPKPTPPPNPEPMPKHIHEPNNQLCLHPDGRCWLCIIGITCILLGILITFFSILGNVSCETQQCHNVCMVWMGGGIFLTVVGLGFPLFLVWDQNTANKIVIAKAVRSGEYNSVHGDVV